MSREEKGPNQVCVCGHAREKHAEFIDNQLGSANPEVQRRHCLHDSKARSTETIFACGCKTFRAVGVQK